MWRKKRKEILKRDNNECQICKKKGKVKVGKKGEELTVHHIKEIKEYPEMMLENSNLITVCFECHNEIHNRFDKRKIKKIKIEVEERW